VTFALETLRARAANGPVVRVVVAETHGSVPREIGAAMLVTSNDLEGTIGGGALEFEAIRMARTMLTSGEQKRVERKPLGPALGQCCGGAVTLLSETWTTETLSDLAHEFVARPLPGSPTEPPLSVRRILADARSNGAVVRPGLVSGWMIEPISRPCRDIWVWGAGHVGRAVVTALSPLPGISIFWIDTDQTRFPDAIPENAKVLVAENPADLASLASGHAEHLVLTFSHALDLEICHRVLSAQFKSLGLIGSATKKARFRKRLTALGHSQPVTDRMVCPIGDPSLGKHPHAIAIGVAADLIRSASAGGKQMMGRTA
jgi:xanthine dehydrogenase accessory factor